jgi:predicted RNA-binding Zn-ribbon protein involved in translation (DUF1610 family)
MACTSCKLSRIIKGWKALIWENPEAEKIAIGRAKICAKCKYLNKLGFCKKCGCYVKAKARVIEETCILWPE